MRIKLIAGKAKNSKIKLVPTAVKHKKRPKKDFTGSLEATSSVEVLFGMVPGGRGGNRYSQQTLSLPESFTEEAWADAEEDSSFSFMPNQPEQDIPAIQEALSKGEIWVGWDVFGEGVVGFAPAGTDPKALKLRVLEILNGDED